MKLMYKAGRQSKARAKSTNRRGVQQTIAIDEIMYKESRTADTAKGRAIVQQIGGADAISPCGTQS